MMSLLSLFTRSKPAVRLSPAEACEIARRCYVSGKRNLPEKKKYLPPDRDALHQFLKQRNEFVNYWIAWSEDKRWSPAWFFRKTESGFEVGLLNGTGKSEQRTIYHSAEEACTDYILKELNT